MTREEIIRNLKYTMKKHENDKVDTFGTNISLMCKDILDYLEQEPCDDTISRQYLLDNCVVDKVTMPYVPISKIENAPPVTPQKYGRWIDEGWYAEGHSEHAYRCSECDKHYIGYIGEHKYCPNCGAKMKSYEGLLK
jgi:hypothetical protein